MSTDPLPPRSGDSPAAPLPAKHIPEPYHLPAFPRAGYEAFGRFSRIPHGPIRPNSDPGIAGRAAAREHTRGRHIG